MVVGEVLFPLQGVTGRNVPLMNDTMCRNDLAGTVYGGGVMGILGWGEGDMGGCMGTLGGGAEGTVWGH